MPTIEELETALAEARSKSTPEGMNMGSSMSAPKEDKYAAASQAWGVTVYDFTTPSGKLCQLKKLSVPELAKTGLLERLTRLPGIVDEVIDKSSLKPPAPEKETVSPEEARALGEVLEILLPIVVNQPKVWPQPQNPEDMIEGRIYPSGIDFADQVAILEEVTGGLEKLDNFRKGS